MGLVANMRNVITTLKHNALDYGRQVSNAARRIMFFGKDGTDVRRQIMSVQLP